MNVLFVTHYSDLYGANRSLLNLIIDLKERYNINPFVLIPAKGEIEKELEIRGIPYIYSPYISWLSINGNFKFVKAGIKYIINLCCYYLAFYRIKKMSLDLIHTNSSATDIGDFLNVRMKTKHVWHVREFGEEDYNLTFSYGKKYVKKRFERADKIIFISKAVANKYQNFIKSDNKIIVYNGINIEACEKKINFGDKIRFCIVGLIRSSKGQWDVVKAGKLLLDKGIENFEIHIIGSGDATTYLSELENYVSKNDMERQVRFWGYRNDVMSILDKMDVGIMASNMEAFGRTTVEFMAKKMPVIGSASGGTLEIISNGIDGFFYEPENIDDLAGKMRMFIEDRKMLAAMGENAYDKSLQFSRKVNTDNIFKVYSEIVK